MFVGMDSSRVRIRFSLHLFRLGWFGFSLHLFLLGIVWSGVCIWTDTRAKYCVLWEFDVGGDSL